MVLWFEFLIFAFIFEIGIFTTALIFYFGWNKIMTDAKIKNMKSTILGLQKERHSHH